MVLLLQRARRVVGLALTLCRLRSKPPLIVALSVFLLLLVTMGSPSNLSGPATPSNTHCNSKLWARAPALKIQQLWFSGAWNHAVTCGKR
jgi:hypothetical protein